MWAGIWLDDNLDEVAHYLRAIAAAPRPSPATPITERPTTSGSAQQPRPAKRNIAALITARAAGHCEIMATNCLLTLDAIDSRIRGKLWFELADPSAGYAVCRRCRSVVARMDRPMARKLGYVVDRQADPTATPFFWRQSRWMLLDSVGRAVPPDLFDRATGPDLSEVRHRVPKKVGLVTPDSCAVAADKSDYRDDSANFAAQHAFPARRSRAARGNLSAVPTAARHRDTTKPNSAGPQPDRRTRAANTRRAYNSDWAAFVTWCKQHRHRPLPAEPVIVAEYLRAAADAVGPDGRRRYAASTVCRWASAIAHHHRVSGHVSPTASDVVAEAIAGIRGTRTRHRPVRHAAPLKTADIAAMVAFARKETSGWVSELHERRDSAVLLIGFAAAVGRTDFAELTCADVRVLTTGGYRLRIQRSRHAATLCELPVTDSHETCPPCAAYRWLQVVGAFDAGGRPAVIRLVKNAGPFDRHVCHLPLSRTPASAPLFRPIRRNGNLSDTALTGSAIHSAIRRRAEQAGFAEQFIEALGVHSLTAGFITQAWANGADAPSILRQTGHAGAATLERYTGVHAAIHNAVADLGL
jgi:site-specific recombinase XerD